MPSPFSKTDIANLALQKIGMNPINDIGDLNSATAIACNTAWEISVRSVMRDHDWNCLKKRTVLTEVSIDGSPIGGTTTVVSWAPSTYFLNTQVLSYGQGYYQYYINQTSGTDFMTDLTTNQLYQTDLTSTDDDSFTLPSQDPLYEWDHAYQLPDDFILLVELNGNSALSKLQQGSEYEINGSLLYTDESYADIKYVQYVADVTRYDPLLVDAISIRLAANVATVLKKDNGAMGAALMQMYRDVYLPDARKKDAGERKPRRYIPIADSNFVAARYRSTNS